MSNTLASAAELRRWTDGTLPGFTLPVLDGPDISLDAHRGHVVLVHFFATWCEPCREELPALRRLAQRSPGGTMRVLAISVAEVDITVRRFFETLPVNFPVLLDRDRAIAKQWKIDTLPTTLVFDTQLRPRLIVEADFAWDALNPKRLNEPFNAGN